jgi:serine/threonine-protein kinase
MAITDTFVLPEDVLFIPVGELPQAVRDKLTCKTDDLAITRPNVRAPSKIVSAEAADLLRRFQTPRTIVAAVIDYSQSMQATPEDVLEQALPLLKHLIEANVLLDASSPQVRIQPTLSAGDRFGDFEVRQTVHVVEDTEVFLARSMDGHQDVALKITRSGTAVDLAPALEREAVVLAHLGGAAGPRLVASGAIDGRHFVATEWLYGVPISMVGAELRQTPVHADHPTGDDDAFTRLHRLVIALVEAYATLHDCGIIHADVHPSNLLADDAGAIRIIDFGYARFADPAHPLSVAPRAGAGMFFEPECAAAIVFGRGEQPSSFAGEQYSVAAIAFELFTGATHIDFAPRYDEMIRQIADAEPRAWSDLGVRAWPELEQTLRRALNRDPRLRFGSMREFAAALRSLTPPVRERDTSSGDETGTGAFDKHLQHAGGSGHGRYEQFITDVLARYAPDQNLFRESIGEGSPVPTASANHGAAGIAYALWRLACRRESPELLALADLWITKTLAEATDDRAFYNEALEITKDTVTPISLHHMHSGVYFVRALISRASSDAMTEQMALEAFLQAADGAPDNLDLTLGRMSVLHGCTLLLEDGGPSRHLDVQPILEFGDRIVSDVWTRIDRFAPVAQSPELTFQGMAHGWAGVLYGTMRWQAASHPRRRSSESLALPEALPRRLQELAECGTPLGRGLVWRWHNAKHTELTPGDPGLMPGWCNGNAGHVFLWTLAHQLFDESRYLDLARRAAWGAWELGAQFNNVCCGAAGCAYAMLNLYRRTGDREWLARAQAFGHRVATQPDAPRPDNPGDVHSLYKGDVGLMLLLDDLEEPERARMPLFE